MIEYERHIHAIRKAIFPRPEEEMTRPQFTEIAIVLKNKQKFAGILVEKSALIPLSIDRSSDTILNSLSERNLRVIETHKTMGPVFAACALLQMPFALDSDGIHADTDFVGTIVGLHLHPGGRVETQADFLDLLRKVLKKRGHRLVIGKPL